MRKWSVAGVVLVGVVAAVLGWWRLGAPDREVRDRVLRVLNDPGSAEFVAVVYDDASGAGCGFVNARNSFGAMAGSRAFVAFADGEVRFEPPLADPGHEGWSKLAMTYCERTADNAEVFGTELSKRMELPPQ